MGASASTSYSLEDVKVKYEQLESTLGPVELPAPFAAAPDARCLAIYSVSEINLG